jgi:hypothetical protein
MRSLAVPNAGLRPLGAYIRGKLHEPLRTTRSGYGYMPNLYDACLMGEYRAWNYLIAKGGLERLCLPLGQRPYIDRPWIKQPEEGRAFSPQGVAAVSTIVEGTETALLSLIVPFGYDGVINYIVANILPSASSGTSYSEGSSQITWRLKANGRHLRDWGNVQTSRGSLIDPSPIPNGGLRVYSRNLVQFTVTLEPSSGLTPTANLVCMVMGWFYPR